MEGFRGNRQWDWRAHPARRKCFTPDEGECRDDVKRRALTVLRSYCSGAGVGENDLDGPIWALLDISPSEALRAACLWFKVAVQSGEDEDTRRMLCTEAYGKIERALRCHL